MELTINKGRGYVPSEENRVEDAPLGYILNRCNLYANQEM